MSKVNFIKIYSCLLLLLVMLLCSCSFFDKNDPGLSIELSAFQLNVDGEISYHDEFTEIELTALNKEYKTFSHWQCNGEFLSNNKSISFLLTQDMAIVSVYNDITVSICVDGETQSAVIMQDFEVVAKDKEHHTFSCWQENGEVVSYDKKYAFIASCDRLLIAVYTRNSYVITIDGVDSQVLAEDSVELIAKKIPHKNFVGWYVGEDLISSEENYTFTVVSDIVLDARYDQIFYTVTCGEDTFNVASGRTFTVTAKQINHKVFSHWEANGVKLSTENDYTFTVVENIKLIALYNDLYYNITIGNITYKELSGSSFQLPKTAIEHKKLIGYNIGEKFIDVETNTILVESDMEIVLVYEDIKFSVTVNGVESLALSGSNFEVTAEDKDFLVFDYWEIDGEKISTDKIYTFIVAKDTVIKAVYKDLTYSITVIIDGVKTVYTEKVNTQFKITAEDKLGKDFLCWMIGGVTKVVDISCSILVSKDITITAIYKDKLIDIIVNGVNYKIKYNTTYTAKAKSCEGKTFVGWYANGVLKSKDYNYTFIVVESVELVAVFE